MAMPENDPEGAKATFLFKGSVKKLKAATMRNVPVDDRTAVVRVDQVLEAPRHLIHCAGKDITVQLAAQPSVAVKQQLIFHTTGWIFGDSIAVRAVRQEPVTDAHAAMLAQPGDPVEQRKNRELQERVAGADLVVSGKVVAVNLPAHAVAPTAQAAAPPSRRPVSEHDPKWREAVVAVDKVHVDKVQRGTGAGDRVTVRFPASTDVSWYKAPKFEAGQQGYFVLQKRAPPPAAAAAPARAAAEAAPVPPEEEADVYTALHPLDFQPYSQQNRMHTAISASTDGSNDGKVT